MGYKHSREEILEGALEAALAEGLSPLTFGRLAKRLGVSDRVIVYYFPSKTDLVLSVLELIAARLQAVLADAITQRASGHLELVRAAWPQLANEDIDPIFGLYFEAIGQATAGIEPFAGLAGPLIEGWISWLSGFFDGEAHTCRAEAEAALVLLDGLLLMRQLAGGSAADRAATQLGLSRPDAR
ncbi:TetR/AcrR family transcriptional regulator [Mycolicibacterium sp.]|uniref:TetR/AcrR family transcriptional regulator n=1 Tax=Mycolicibacterium sp. TaxID=2320850 RepID=UPI001A29A314|nr:TetR/AcrR family transcriptional regulator [Mycolicibacterium sp.]MBJ7337616.1 TetR/AcrR family transcriptional regulator [Mycolicibacterium sp.]